MWKLAIVLCVVIFASVPTSTHFSGNVPESIYTTANRVTNDAINRVERKIFEIYRSVNYETKVLLDKVYVFIERSSSEIVKHQLKLIFNIRDVYYDDAEEADISKCMQLYNHLDDTADRVISNSSTCINEKLQTAFGYMEDIHTNFEIARSVIGEIREEAEHCNNNSANSTRQTISCLEEVAAKAFRVYVNIIPKMKIPIYQLSVGVALESCIDPELEPVTEKSSTMFAEAKKCIKEKIDQKKATNSKSDDSPGPIEP